LPSTRLFSSPAVSTPTLSTSPLPPPSSTCCRRCRTHFLLSALVFVVPSRLHVHLISTAVVTYCHHLLQSPL
jgi:hypothetical protein